MELSYRFAADTANLFPGIRQNPEKKHIWNKYSTIGDLRRVYPQFMERVWYYIDDISDETQKSTG